MSESILVALIVCGSILLAIGMVLGYCRWYFSDTNAHHAAGREKGGYS